MGRHCKDISSYEVLQEDDTASTNDILKGLAEECEVLENKLFYIFRQQKKLKKAKQYEALIYAAGRVYEAYGAIRRCIKQKPPRFRSGLTGKFHKDYFLIGCLFCVLFG